MADPYKYLDGRPPYDRYQTFYDRDELLGQNARPGTSPENARALDPVMGASIWSLYQSSPPLRLSMNASQEQLFDKPFDIAIGGANGHMVLAPHVREHVIREFWVPAMRTIDLHQRLFGVAPYYFRTIRVPAVMVRGGSKRAGSRASPSASPPSKTEKTKNTEEDEEEDGEEEEEDETTSSANNKRKAVAGQDSVLGRFEGLATLRTPATSKSRPAGPTSPIPSPSSASSSSGARSSKKAKSPRKTNKSTSMPSHPLEQSEVAFIDLDIPEIPPFGSGAIETYVTDAQQHFQWRWHKWAMPTRCRHPIDKKVFIEIKDTPDIWGRLTSPIAALMSEYKFVTGLRNLMNRGNAQAVNPQHIVEYHPDLANATGSVGSGGHTAASSPYSLLGQSRYPSENVSTGSSRTNLESVSDFHRKQRMQDGAITGGVGNGTTESAVLAPGSYASATGGSSGSSDAAIRQKRQIFLDNHPDALGLWNLDPSGSDGNDINPPVQSMQNRAHYLHPYQRYVPTPVHMPDTSALLPFTVRFDRFIAAINGYPMELVMGVGGQSAGSDKSGSSGSTGSSPGGSGGNAASVQNTSGMYRQVVTYLRTESARYADMARRMLLRAYAPLFSDAYSSSITLFKLHNGRRPTVDEQAVLHSNLDIRVIFPRTPIMTFEELARLYEHRMITAETFFEAVTDIVSLGDLAPPKEMEKAIKLLYPLQTPEVRAAGQGGGSVAATGGDKKKKTAAATATSADASKNKKRERTKDSAGGSSKSSDSTKPKKKKARTKE